MRPEDARAFLEVHHAAVHEIAARDYPSTVIEAWAPLPLTEDAIKPVRLNPDGEYRLIAEIDVRIVGIGVQFRNSPALNPRSVGRFACVMLLSRAYAR
jgi:putative acetyltransferase